MGKKYRLHKDCNNAIEVYISVVEYKCVKDKGKKRFLVSKN